MQGGCNRRVVNDLPSPVVGIDLKRSLIGYVKRSISHTDTFGAVNSKHHDGPADTTTVTALGGSAEGVVVERAMIARGLEYRERAALERSVDCLLNIGVKAGEGLAVRFQREEYSRHHMLVVASNFLAVQNQMRKPNGCLHIPRRHEVFGALMVELETSCPLLQDIVQADVAISRDSCGPTSPISDWRILHLCASKTNLLAHKVLICAK